MRRLTVFTFHLMIALLLISIETVGQQRDLTSQSVPKITKSRMPDGQVKNIISSQQLNYSNDICGYLGKLVRSYPTYDPTNKTINSWFEISGNEFNRLNPDTNGNVSTCPEINIKLSQNIMGFILTNDFKSEVLSVSGLNGSLNISENKASGLMVNEVSGGELIVGTNKLEGALQISAFDGRSLQISANHFSKDKALIWINRSKVDQISIVDNSTKYLEVSCFSDTIGSFFISENLDKNTSTIGIIGFYGCFINGDVITVLTKGNNRRKIVFKDCHFGKKASLGELNADTLEFINCLEIESRLFFSAEPRLKKVVLKFQNTDFTNFNFNYTDQYRLFKDDAPEVVKSNFENLIVKFSNEKRGASLERLEKEYFEYNNGTVVSWINMVWWDYGFKPGRIVIWTFIFITIFTVINFASWDTVIKCYPIVVRSEFEDQAISHRINWIARRILRVFIYTCLIVFSLRIDFDKLSFKRPGFLFYFFLQYLTGLLCLLFIANAVIKF